jgi:hypothetical protein
MGNTAMVAGASAAVAALFFLKKEGLRVIDKGAGAFQ